MHGPMRRAILADAFEIKGEFLFELVAKSHVKHKKVYFFCLPAFHRVGKSVAIILGGALAAFAAYAADGLTGITAQ